MRRLSLARTADRIWYGPSIAGLALQPLAGIFGLLVRLRRTAWRRGWLTVQRVPVPVIVVGNLTVGGTGKTPVVRWLSALLCQAGYRPGIVSRGYGGQSPSQTHGHTHGHNHEKTRLVQPGDRADEVGDEPLYLRRSADVPVAVNPDRVAAARALVAQGVDVIIADDGLQHYRLGRDMEIAVIDGVRRFGNGRLLPAGPLREPPDRLRETDLVVVNGGPAGPGERAFRLVPMAAVPMSGGARRDLSEFRGRRVYAIAGIGHPARFFAELASQGMDVIPVPVADHERVSPDRLPEDAAIPVLMTEKDAVKYPDWERDNTWVVPVEVQMPEAVGAEVLHRLGTVAGSRVWKDAS